MASRNVTRYRQEQMVSAIRSGRPYEDVAAEYHTSVSALQGVVRRFDEALHEKTIVARQKVRSRARSDKVFQRRVEAAKDIRNGVPIEVAAQRHRVGLDGLRDTLREYDPDLYQRVLKDERTARALARAQRLEAMADTLIDALDAGGTFTDVAERYDLPVSPVKALVKDRDYDLYRDVLARERGATKSTKASTTRKTSTTSKTQKTQKTRETAMAGKEGSR